MMRIEVFLDSAASAAALKRGVLARALKIETIPEADLQTLNAYAQRLSGTPEPVATSPRNE